MKIKKHSLIYLMSVIFLFAPSFAWAQIEPLEILPAEAPEGLPLVFGKYPGMAVLVFNSSITTLTFESSWGVISREYSVPESGKYILIIDPVRQTIRVSAPGYSPVETAISTIKAKEVQYFTAQEAFQAQYRAAWGKYDSGDYRGALRDLQIYLRENLTEEQKVAGYMLLGRAAARNQDLEQMRIALRQLLAVDPEIKPDLSIDPPVMVRFLAQQQDSLQRIPPAQPKGLAALAQNNQVSLSWNGNTESDLAGYRIYKGTSPTNMTLLVDRAGRATRFVDVDVENFTTYFYSIRAYDTSRPISISPATDVISTTPVVPIEERFTLASSSTKVVANPAFSVTNGKFVIQYNLDLGSDVKYNIAVQISNNNGQSFTIIPTSLSGDFGSNVAAGPEKQIEWDYLIDSPSGLPESAYQVQITAVPQKKSKLLWWIGGGLLAGGGAAAAILLTSGGDTETGVSSIGFPAGHPDN